MRRHQNIAFRTAWLIAGSAAEAEEAVQDAFVKAYRALGRFRRGAPLRPWLLTIVANEARNRARASGRRERLALRVAEERRPGDAVPSPRRRSSTTSGATSCSARWRSCRRRPRRDRLPLPARPERGGDRRRAGLPARDGQVARVASAGAAARTFGGERWLSSSATWAGSPRPRLATGAGRDREVMARLEEPGAPAAAARREPRFGGRRCRARRSLAPCARARRPGAAAARRRRPGRRPGARHALLDLFGLRGATVERRDRLPTPPPERALDLGTRTTLASGRLAFDPLVPGGLGEPAGVYVRRATPGGELSLSYLARAGPAAHRRHPARPDRLGVPRRPRARVRRQAGRHRNDGGAPAHRRVPGRLDRGRAALLLLSRPGRPVRRGSLRLARNVLLVERGDLLIRLEGALARERAVAIARSLR